MPLRTTRSIFTLFLIALVSATITRAQSPIPIEKPADTPNTSWQLAKARGDSQHKLFVVTLDQPQRRQSCHVQSLTAEKLVCSRAIGGPRTFLPQQILALIVPGGNGTLIRLMLGFNMGLGTAIWGTVALLATCPACAVGTGIAAFICFVVAAGTLASGTDPDRLLYVAPGQKLTGKLRLIEPL